MKQRIFRTYLKQSSRLPVFRLVLSACILAFAGAPVARGIDSGQGNSSTFTDKMRDWQEEMSQAFHDTWKDLWQNKSAKSLSGSSISTASMDLREQPDSYTVRLNLPNRNLDKVDVKITGDTLHIVAPAEGNASQYEQDVRLADVAADAKPVVERKQDENLIVVTVPKAGGQAAPAPREITSSDDWDRDVLDQMSRMQREMNQIFDNSFAEFRNTPDLKQFFNEPSFGSSLDLQEKGDKYVIRAYLPDRNMSNVKVTVNGQTLKLEAEAENTEKDGNGGAVFSRKSNYSQSLTLPGPVDAGKMTVERKENMLVVTLPKAA